ncbi:MAG: ABC transporter substrate-binding protein [Desulfatitalea sp.]
MFKEVRAALLAALILWAGPCLHVQAREITDMTGRRVTVPEATLTAYGASPPATYMVYAVDPGLVAGLNSPLNPSEKRYLDPRMQKLPVIGGWFGQGRVANLETLLAVRPDIILMNRWWWESASNAKIEQALKPLGIPIVYIVLDNLADYPKAFDFLGTLFDRKERTRALGRYAETAFETTSRVRASIPAEKRVSVYYAEGPDGLSTECHTSAHAQLIPLSGGENVHRCEDTDNYGMRKISMEQVLGYDPQVIVYHEPLFFDGMKSDPKWKNIRAVRENRVYRIPRAPFNWFDRPPSFMRLLGIQWMTHRLYPEAYPIDLVAETQRFYHLFLNVNLDEAAARELLKP